MPRPSAITKEQIKSFKDALNRGETMKDAMINELGLSEKTAARGKASLSKRILSELAKDGLQFAKIGKGMTPEFQENFVRGKLYSNALEGHDKGFNSLKALGQDRRVNMFTPDSVAGIVVIESPRTIPVLADSSIVPSTIDAQ